MASRSQHYAFQLATTVQPANGGHAYLFGSNNNASENDLSEEDGESCELRPRGRERTRRSTSRERMDDIIYLARDVQEGETLNSIALKYHCSVADIKRANNLLTEQDFFALRSVKIPVKRFSVLTETHGAAAAATALKSASPASTQRVPPVPSCLVTAAVASSSSSLPIESSTDSSSSTDSVEGFLLEKDKDIEQLVKSTGPSRSSLNEVVSSLTLQQQQGEVEYKAAPRRKDQYHGADWGMRWWTAVAIMVVVGIITPVFYLLYYEVLVRADVSHHGGGIPPQGGGGGADPGPPGHNEGNIGNDHVPGNPVNGGDPQHQADGADHKLGDPSEERHQQKNT